MHLPYAQPWPTSSASRFVRDEEAAWSRNLPPAWMDLVVVPVAFDVFREYEIAADRTVGRDEDAAACYCASRYLMTDLRSDDDDTFYEALSYAETLTAWRLRDDRWLIHRSVVGPCHDGGQNFFTLSDSMPR